MVGVLWWELGRLAPLRLVALCLVNNMGMGTGRSLLCPVGQEGVDRKAGGLCPQLALGGGNARLVLDRMAALGCLELLCHDVAVRVASGLWACPPPLPGLAVGVLAACLNLYIRRGLPA